MKPNSIKQVEVQIMGQPYTLACPPEGEATLQAAVEKVDSAMCRIRDLGKVRARDRIAVLAMLNLAYELTQSNRGLDNTPATQVQMQAIIQRLDDALEAPNVNR